MKHFRLNSFRLPVLSFFIIIQASLATAEQAIELSAVIGSEPPAAEKFSANVQLLARHRQPDWRTKGYGYLLFGESLSTSSDHARQACQTLFTEAKLYDKPTIASDTRVPVTYVVASAAQDYERASARYKWSVCSRLPEYVDQKRESSLLSTFGLPANQGPWLVHIPQAYRNQQIPESAIALSLKGQPHQLVLQWKIALRKTPELGKKAGDVQELSKQLDINSDQKLLITYFDHKPEIQRVTQR